MKKLLNICCLIFLSVIAFGQTDGIEFNIRFFDKQIYFTDSAVYIKAEIINNTMAPFRFKVADNKVYNLDFDVRSLTNIRLNHSDIFIRERNKNQAVFYREFSLEPGEAYSFTDDLANYIDFEEAGVYLVQAVFYPELPAGNIDNIILSENTLTLSLRPRAGISEMEARIDDLTGEVLQKVMIPPDLVVDYLVNARQKTQWDKFFLYLDLKAMMMNDSVRAMQYRSYSDDRQRAMLDQYKTALMQEKEENDILLIPTFFEILKTTYTSDEGSVKVLEKFHYIDFTEIKEYTYYLHKVDDIWMIYDYEVLNLGTE